jgi:hypothetical protein
MLGWLHTGVGELIRQAGVQLMEAEVQERVGERSQWQTDSHGPSLGQ